MIPANSVRAFQAVQGAARAGVHIAGLLHHTIKGIPYGPEMLRAVLGREPTPAEMTIAQRATMEALRGEVPR